MRFRTWFSTAAIVLMTTATLYAQAPVPPVNAPGNPQNTFNGQSQPGHHHHKAGWQQFVGLTPEQRQQVRPMQKAYQQANRGLRQQQQGQIVAMLTPQQQQALSDLQAQNPRLQLKGGSKAPRLPKGWQRAVGLTPQQRQQIKALHQQTRSQHMQFQSQFLAQVQPVLNPDQRARLDQYLQSHHGRV